MMRRGAASLRLVLANGFALLVSKGRSRRAGPMGGVVIGGLVSTASDDACGTEPRADRSLGYPLMMVRLVKSLIVLQPPEDPCSKSVRRSVWAEYGCVPSRRCSRGEPGTVAEVRTALISPFHSEQPPSGRAGLPVHPRVRRRRHPCSHRFSNQLGPRTICRSYWRPRDFCWSRRMR